MISGMIDSAKNSDLNGVLVRSFIHASAVPTTKANTAVPLAKPIELNSNLSVSTLV